MGITNSNKEINVSTIKCNESFKIKLSLAAEPDIVSNPTDIVLILDKSGSMAGSPFANLKLAVNTFIDIIEESTDGVKDGIIGSGSRIGIVSFESVATQDTQLITSVEQLKNTVDGLTAGGNTNHEDAFTKALELFDPNSTNAKVMVMFTDGVTTAGGNANTVATLAKSQGVIIYVIGLLGNGGIDEQALRDWASDPDSSYLSIAPTEEELVELFENLARNITNPGATNITIRDVVSQCFNVVSIQAPSKGIASLIDSKTVEWKIDELGVSQSEGASLEFIVEHIGPCSGEVLVNESITYSDDENNVVSFPSPTVNIDCGTIIIKEDCPIPQDIEIQGCNDIVEYDATDLDLNSIGRILKLNVKLKNICPNRRVALAIILNEVDENEIEHKRGLKIMSIPAHNKDACQDILVKCVKFVLPEDLNETAASMCEQRNFKVRFIAHYIDNDYNCCDDVE